MSCMFTERIKKAFEQISWWRMNRLVSSPKGQLILKCLFGVIVPTKKQWKYCKDFCPESFYSFLGASCRLPNKLYYLISSKEAPKSFKEAPRKLQKHSVLKSLQYFCCYFGRNDDTKKTFWNELTFKNEFTLLWFTHSRK